ncbi:MAG: response regulator transcription factor [Clostridiales bacterium]|nr:response regulator transcription factor [Clostridiales bacterium]
MSRMLIVDDDMHLRKLVRTYAELEYFQCKEAENADECIDLILREAFDIIILDIMMPGQDGFELLARIRKERQIPVIMLTARGEEYDKLLGFQLGADDYVIKPFSPKELMARVQAVLKRAGLQTLDELRFGGLCIRIKERQVLLDGKQISLPPKEFDLLLKLARNERIVLTREKLLETVWGYEYSGDTRTVDTHIRSLREHLGDYRRLIRTIWGVGYKFEYTDNE